MVTNGIGLSYTTPHHKELIWTNFSVGKKQSQALCFDENDFIEPNSYRVVEIPRQEDMDKES